MIIAVASGAHASDTAPLRLTCSHPFEASHPLAEDFLRPWANGIAADSGGALQVELVASATSLSSCALAPVDTALGALLALPFQMPDDARRASEVAYASLHEEETRAGDPPTKVLLAAVMLPLDMVGTGESRMPPLPGGLEGQRLEAPTDAVAELLKQIGAEVVAQTEAPVTAHLATLSMYPEAAWIMTFEAGRSLYSRPFALRVSADQMAALPAPFRALMTQVPGQALSAAAGRALNRARAVGLEAAERRGVRVSLSEDRTGQALGRAAALSETWRTQNAAHRAAYEVFLAGKAIASGPSR
ncbi:MAG: hypothetical protein AAGB05_07045 [Pseudomonadota bacterium]